MTLEISEKAITEFLGSKSSSHAAIDSVWGLTEPHRQTGMNNTTAKDSLSNINKKQSKRINVGRNELNSRYISEEQSKQCE